jgi:glycosyltransferase involved in cell wall biosynthesis
VPFALEAFGKLRQALPAARFLLVGTGPIIESLQAQVKTDGLTGSVAFTGGLPGAELPAVYAAADVFAFPSITETQGLVLAEAFAAGLPVVAVDTPQTRDVFGANHAGELVKDPEAMALALQGFLTDPERRAAASAHALTAAAAFDAKATAGRVVAVYSAVVANRAGEAEMSDFAALFDPIEEARPQSGQL